MLASLLFLVSTSACCHQRLWHADLWPPSDGPSFQWDSSSVRIQIYNMQIAPVAQMFIPGPRLILVNIKLSSWSTPRLGLAWLRLLFRSARTSRLTVVYYNRGNSSTFSGKCEFRFDILRVAESVKSERKYKLISCRIITERKQLSIHTRTSWYAVNCSLAIMINATVKIYTITITPAWS